MLSVRFGALASAVLVAAAACQAASGELEDDGPSTQAGPSSTTTGMGGAGGEGGQTITVGEGGFGGSPEITEVFGHSGDTLYRLDPVTNVVTEVGEFGNCGSGSIIDIALDEDSNLYGVKFKALYAIDRETAACTLINELPDNEDYPTSLGFVPAGTVDSTVEALVGYQDQAYVRIDLQSGTISTINATALGPPLNKFSSGDIVSVKDGPTYLTVKESNDPCNPNCPDDEIISVNPQTGVPIQNFGSVDYPEVFGIAFWGGDVFGFAREGTLFRVVFGDQSVTTTAIDFPQAPPGLSFFGAGSSTSVPIVIPR